ncbi:MAG: hypothetical protein Q9M19_06185 [Mariprofundaceae bacterium]|nr:hypothetical protein [Mariprofundaceae bacterium]
MSQVNVSCPRCQEKFQAEKEDAYECPKCGTSIRPKKDDDNHDQTQIFKV